MVVMVVVVVVGLLNVMHNRSCMTIYYRIPTMTRRSPSGVDRQSRNYEHQAQRTVRYSTSRMEGRMCLSKNCCADVRFTTPHKQSNESFREKQNGNGALVV